MKDKIINVLIWLAIIGIVFFWTWFLEWSAPGTPFQAFFASLLLFTPSTILIIISLIGISKKIERGEQLRVRQEPKGVGQPTNYRVSDERNGIMIIKAIKRFFNYAAEQAEEKRRREEEWRQMMRDNLEAWNELNKDFIEENNRRIDREIDEKYDFTKVPEPDAYGFDGSPLGR